MKQLQDLQPLPSVKPASGPAGTPLRVAFWTLGCRLNQYDTEGIKASMAGVYDIDVVGWNDPAHLYVLNRCTVTAKAGLVVKNTQPQSRPQDTASTRASTTNARTARRLADAASRKTFTGSLRAVPK